MSDDVAGPGTGYVDEETSRFDRFAHHFGGVDYWFGAGTAAVGSGMVVGSGMLSPSMLFGTGLATLGAVATYAVMADE